MFGLNTWEIIIIIVIAVVLFGSQAPKLIAKLFKTGKDVMVEVTKGVDQLKESEIKDKGEDKKISKQ